MLIEHAELTLGHVGLGRLTEVAVLGLFATAQSHALTKGTSAERDGLRGIVDSDGMGLYPTYYVTHLRAPPTALIDRFQVWDEVKVGVDVQCFGGVLLDSQYVLGGGDDPIEERPRWEGLDLPSMRASSMFVLDNHVGDPRPSRPKAGTTAALRALPSPPVSMEAFRAARSTGVVASFGDGPLRPRDPIEYSVVPSRDAPVGRAMMFSRFTEIMLYAERELLGRRLTPAFPESLLDCAAVLERETYYFGNARAGSVIDVHARARVEPCSNSMLGAGSKRVSLGILSFHHELYERATNDLIAIARSRSVLAVPNGLQSAMRDAERMLHAHAAPDADAERRS